MTVGDGSTSIEAKGSGSIKTPAVAKFVESPLTTSACTALEKEPALVPEVNLPLASTVPASASDVQEIVASVIWFANWSNISHVWKTVSGF